MYRRRISHSERRHHELPLAGPQPNPDKRDLLRAWMLLRRIIAATLELTSSWGWPIPDNPFDLRFLREYEDLSMLSHFVERLLPLLLITARRFPSLYRSFISEFDTCNSLSSDEYSLDLDQFDDSLPQLYVDVRRFGVHAIRNLHDSAGRLTTDLYEPVGLLFDDPGLPVDRLVSLIQRALWILRAHPSWRSCLLLPPSDADAA